MVGPAEEMPPDIREFVHALPLIYISSEKRALVFCVVLPTDKPVRLVTVTLIMAHCRYAPSVDSPEGGNRNCMQMPRSKDTLFSIQLPRRTSGQGAQGDQCASFQLAPIPASTLSGTESVNAPLIRSTAHSLNSGALSAGSSNTSSSCTCNSIAASGNASGSLA